MKIAMYNVTTTIKAGGIETFIWEVSKKLAALGHKVDIIGGRGIVPCDLPDNLSVIQTPYLPRKYIPNFGTRFRKLVERFSFAIFAFRGILKKKYDIIHIFKPYDFPVASLLKKLTGAIICYGSHGTDFYPCDKIFLKHIDIFFACSKFNADQIRNRYAVAPIVLYNGFDKDKFKVTCSSNELKNILRIENDEKVIIAVNRLVGWKGTHHLIKAFKKVLSTVQSKLIIIGEGKEKNNLIKLVNSLNISDKVIFTGYIPNEKLPEYFSISDIYILASVADETFGITLCEAMGCEKAVISTEVGGIPEVVEDGVTGYLVTPNDAEKLTDKMILLLKDKNLRKKMGEKGRQRALEFFTWNRIVDDLIACYKTVMK